MKSIIKNTGFIASLVFIGLLFAMPLSSEAQNKKTVDTEFKVYGNCNMCKMTIEKALDVKGVRRAEWDRGTKMLKVSYKSKYISEEQLHELIAAAGYDTEKTRASDEAYEKLHKCCKYERRKDEE